MRARRWLGFVASVAWIVMMMPTEASADGGAYIDLDRTHFLVGSTGHAEIYVSVPASKQGLFERGPFYLYVTPGRSPVTEGRPLPSTAVRLATMTIEHDRRTAFELSASFTVPDLPGDYYALGVCNDPCTISGFREPLTGEISIVADAARGGAVERTPAPERPGLRPEAGHAEAPARQRRPLEPARGLRPSRGRTERGGRTAPEHARRTVRLSEDRSGSSCRGSDALWVATIVVAAGDRRRPATPAGHGR
jgi:hypothetical protein